MAGTHRVENQVALLSGYNLFTTDPVLADAVTARHPGFETGDLEHFGAEVTTEESYHHGFLANEHPPTLKTHDRVGNRVDEVEFHPSWHFLMERAVTNGLHCLPWESGSGDGAHTRRAALNFMASQIESGHFCPVSMTYSAIPALRATPAVSAAWEPGVLSRTYDPTSAPPDAKKGLLLGMGMTEKQGGSDVRANTTRAIPVNGGGPGGEYRVTGHKWFTSAPMNDAFLVLAQAPGGLSCLLVPRWDPGGERNSFLLQRLKDKLGNRSNASAEVEFDNAFALLVGEEGRGVATIIEMVNGTRLDCVIGSAALMRQAVSQAAWHVKHRAAFGTNLIDKPLMQNVIADLEVETEVATLMIVRLAAAFDAAEDDDSEAAHKRIALPIAKYWVTKRCSEVVREALECLGGNGYVEESIMPRLYRESPVNAIWEGSGNVIALDVLRAISRTPDGFTHFLDELASVPGRPDVIEQSVDLCREMVSASSDLEFDARRIVEKLAVTWGAALALEADDEDLADAYIATRLRGSHTTPFGTLPDRAVAERLVQRAVPAA